MHVFIIAAQSADGFITPKKSAVSGGATRHRGAAQAPPAGAPLIVVLPNAAIREPGSWVLRLRTQQGEEMARYPFSVQFH